MAGICFLCKKVWDGEQFVEYSYEEIKSSDACAYFTFSSGTDLNFFGSSGYPINRVILDEYLEYEDGYPELTEVHYQGRVLVPDQYLLPDEDSEIIAYYGAIPEAPDNPGSDIPTGGYTLNITYKHNESLGTYDESSYTHYGAWLSDDTMETVFYYDKDGNIQRINRLPGMGNVYNWILSHSTLKGYSESNPCYSNAQVNYVVSDAADLILTIGNDGGTTDPKPTALFPLADVNIGESYMITALPYVGYTVDHWAVFDKKMEAWVDLSESGTTYVLSVVDPGYTYQVKVYFKETTLNNKIATKNDLNYLIPSVTFYTSDVSNCPTASTIKNSSKQTADYVYRLRVNGTYADNQLVRLKDCSWSQESLEYIIHVQGTYINASGSGYYSGTWFSEGSYQSQYVQATVKFYTSYGLAATEYTQMKIQARQYGTQQYSLEWAHLTPIMHTFNKSTKINRIEIQLANGFGFQSGGSKQLAEYEQGRDYTWNVQGQVVG